ncbi:adenylate/guanylate cyclase domain-containing protein [Smaragdicoccus niigatensis]|uniref:adenylate/guanylate cyclase domain-containing protein n=1 Tax=Smaragdicoccus niigatensis TaxID=359359 RepID=UPI000371FF53|nr:adenylate/guanylate cyclase domain-containing protein [Smaragdicoccus niigatensis]
MDHAGMILGSEPKYTIAEVAALAGVPVERVVEIRTLVALAIPTADEIAYNDDDVEAVQMLTLLRESGILDEATERSVARSMGRSLARLAEWQADLVYDFVESSDGGVDELTAITTLIEPLERIQNILWRRHLLDADARRSGNTAGEVDMLAVGFADVVGFTSLSRGLTRRQLSVFLERFESDVAETVGRHGGRIIKMIGDEVMFVADEPVAAARIGLELAARERTFDGRPELRVGVAYGAVLRQLGDVHGTVVNMAARLTAVARPGSVMMDNAMATALEGHPEFYVRDLRRVDVKGFSHLQPWLLRRPKQVGDPPTEAFQIPPELLDRR